MKVTAVSDTHLNIEESQKDKFNEFLDYELETAGEEDVLIIAGDFLDVWRRDCMGCPTRNSDTIEKIKDLNEKMEVHYLVGNHDQHYSIGLEPQLNEIEYEEEVTIDVAGTQVKFQHGHQFDPLQNEAFSEILTHSSDYSGEYADEVWDIIRGDENFFERYLDKFVDLFTGGRSEKRKIARGMDKATEVLKAGEIGPVDQAAREELERIDQEKLVYGHTHDEFISRDNKLANLGAWVSKEGVYNTLVTIDEDAELTLKRYLGGDEFEEIQEIYEFE